MKNRANDHSKYALWIDPAEVVPYERNAKIHTDKQIDNICTSIRRFGWQQDTVITKDNVLVIGHGRRLAALKPGREMPYHVMAFDEVLPKNSESRCIAVAIRLIRKNAPHIKWILSYADGMQCGDGTIYRASGFKLTGFSTGSMWLLPPKLREMNGGAVAHRMKIQDKSSAISRWVMARTNGKNLTMEQCAKKFGGEVCEGYMLRYVKILDPSYHLTVPEIPFSEIEARGAGMYKGEKR